MDDETYQQLRDELTDKRDELHRRVRKIRAGEKHAERHELDKDLEDQAIQLENDEVLQKLEPATRRELKDVLAALERMDEGNYGECQSCGGDIGIGRLEAIPSARLCIECAEEAELEQGS